MSATNAFENDILDLIFNAVTIADIAENDTTSPATAYYVSLHTADPGEAGDQTTNETSYTNYARVSVNRNAGGWTITGSSVSPTSTITFPVCTGGTATITHVGIGTGSAGAGYLMLSGTVTPNLSVSNGVTPRITTSTTITLD